MQLNGPEKAGLCELEEFNAVVRAATRIIQAADAFSHFMDSKSQVWYKKRFCQL